MLDNFNAEIITDSGWFVVRVTMAGNVVEFKYPSRAEALNIYNELIRG